MSTEQLAAEALLALNHQQLNNNLKILKLYGLLDDDSCRPIVYSYDFVIIERVGLMSVVMNSFENVTPETLLYALRYGSLLCYMNLHRLGCGILAYGEVPTKLKANHCLKPSNGSLVIWNSFLLLSRF